MGEEILQEYRKKVVVFVLAIVCFSATAAALVLPGMKLFGLYSRVSWGICGIFIAVIMVEDISGIWLIRKSAEQEVLSSKLEKNNSKVNMLLNKVSDIAGHLGEASHALVGTSQKESASTEELSAISDTLLENSTVMMEKSE